MVRYLAEINLSLIKRECGAGGGDDDDNDDDER